MPFKYSMQREIFAPHFEKYASSLTEWWFYTGEFGATRRNFGAFVAADAPSGQLRSG